MKRKLLFVIPSQLFNPLNLVFALSFLTIFLAEVSVISFIDLVRPAVITILSRIHGITYLTKTGVHV